VAPSTAGREDVLANWLAVDHQAAQQVDRLIAQRDQVLPCVSALQNFDAASLGGEVDLILSVVRWPSTRARSRTALTFARTFCAARGFEYQIGSITFGTASVSTSPTE
jgi:hypothetical protein